jgi:pilus assembly protein CpaE
MLKAIIVESDPETCGTIRRMVSSYPAVAVVGEYATLHEVLAEGIGRRPDLMIVEIPYDAAKPDVTRVAQTVESLVRAAPEAALIVTGSPAPADLVLQVIRAGALEFLRRPVQREELLTVLEKVARLRRSGGAARPAGRITAVYSTKGGLGVTTMAANLAVCLAEQTPGSTVLLDLDTRQSDITTLLNLQPTYSVLDAFENVDRLDESFLSGLLLKHRSGLLVLPGPTRMERVQLAAEQVRTVLEVIRSHFANVVLDLRHDLDTGTIAALEAADTILFLTSLDVCALRSGAAGITAFRHLGLSVQKLKLIVMREDTGEDVTLKHGRDTLGLPIFWKVPSDYRSVVASINGGEPVVTASPRSKVAKNIRQLATALTSTRAVGASSPLRSAASVARLVWHPGGSGQDR